MPNNRGRSRGSHPKSSTSRSISTRRGSSSIVGRGREIANEWSPRGRGSNNTSGNGRGRAYDCGPRGRGSKNTFGNGRGLADDISPRGRGSNNRDISNDCSQIGRASSSIGGRGNKSANEWCPGLNILGDEILDVHEDNKEHVEEEATILLGMVEAEHMIAAREEEEAKILLGTVGA
nr:hypothetical protein [Tanacetum cinerariifolium]